MPDCIHRGRQVAKITPCCDKPEAGQFLCGLFEVCTDAPLGFINKKTGQPMATCVLADGKPCPGFVAAERPTVPKVSAICCAYDLPARLEVLNEAVESFLRQDWPDKELIVVNDTPGIVIEFDHPQVRILNLTERFPTLGDKYNAGCEAATGDLLCSWDDDDISLPWRMSRAIERLGKADYYNPQAYWCIYEGNLRHEVKTGIAHNAAMVRKSAWEKAGKYPSLNGRQDIELDVALRKQVPTVAGNGDIADSGYIYRVGEGLLHLSTHSSDTDKTYAECAGRGTPGLYKLTPRWREDYVALVRAQMPAAQGPKLTIGMATFRDWPGVWATCQSIQLNHPECVGEIEIVIVDNDPDGKPDERGEKNHSFKAKQLCARNGWKYEHFTAVQGTAAAKGRIFDLATAPNVLVVDCHVILPSGTIRRLIEWMTSRPDSKDLWQGPCIGDGGLDDIVGTHFRQAWGSLMYGQWSTDQRAQGQEPFEILMQGCGLFACSKKAWPGFHPLLRGFGPEEFHIHQRIRARGGKAYCLPWLRWCHRFGNPAGTSPPGLHPEERLRGHLITHLDTGAPPPTEIRKHFVEDPQPGTNQPALTNQQFFDVLADTVDEFWQHRDTCTACPHRRPFLRTVKCQIGCEATRELLPIFSCEKHGECAPWKWQRTGEETTAVCLGCKDGPAAG